MIIHGIDVDQVVSMVEAEMLSEVGEQGVADTIHKLVDDYQRLTQEEKAALVRAVYDDIFK